MANTITVTNTFSPNTKAQSAQVNENFLDLVGGLSDNTKDINPAVIWLRDVTITTDTIISSGDSVAAFCYMAYPDTTTGLNITLPTASASDGRLISVINMDGNGPVTVITPDTATTIDGLTGTSGITLSGQCEGFFGMCGVSGYTSISQRQSTSDMLGLQYDHDSVESVLSSDYTLTTSYGNIGIAATITSGTWFINMCLTMHVAESGASNNIIGARLHDGSTALSGSFLFHRSDATNFGLNITQSLGMVHTVNTTTVLNVQGQAFINTYNSAFIYANDKTHVSDIQSSSLLSCVRLKKS